MYVISFDDALIQEQEDIYYRCSANEVLVGHVIGRGASSTVRCALHVPTHRCLAVKVGGNKMDNF